MGHVKASMRSSRHPNPRPGRKSGGHQNHCFERVGGQTREEAVLQGPEYLPSPCILRLGTLLEKGHLPQPSAKAKTQDLSQGQTSPLSVV